MNRTVDDQEPDYQAQSRRRFWLINNHRLHTSDSRDRMAVELFGIGEEWQQQQQGNSIVVTAGRAITIQSHTFLHSKSVEKNVRPISRARPPKQRQ
jgi:hypothetical protein